MSTKIAVTVSGLSLLVVLALWQVVCLHARKLDRLEENTSRVIVNLTRDLYDRDQDIQELRRAIKNVGR